MKKFYLTQIFIEIFLLDMGYLTQLRPTQGWPQLSKWGADDLKFVIWRLLSDTPHFVI